MSPSEVADIDDWRFRRRIGSRGDAIRRLCQLGMTLSEEMIPALDRSEQLMDDAYAGLSIVSQIARSEHYDKAQAAQAAYDILDKLSDKAYQLYLDVMEMNNVAQRAMQAGSYAAAVIAVRRERESLEKMRKNFIDYIGRRTEQDRQGEENARMMLAFSKLTPEERAAYDELDEDKQDKFIEHLLANTSDSPSIRSSE